jgi:hypothetical protein
MHIEPTGDRVVVIDPDTGRELFTGHLASVGPPWLGWHRVIPDQPFIDLPPKWRVEQKK